MTATTGTPPDLETLTVKAADVKIGDLIDGRSVRLVHNKPQTATACYSAATAKDHNPSNAMPSLTFKCHVVSIFFEDRGVPKVKWPWRLIEVQRP